MGRQIEIEEEKERAEKNKRELERGEPKKWDRRKEATTVCKHEKRL